MYYQITNSVVQIPSYQGDSFSANHEFPEF